MSTRTHRSRPSRRPGLERLEDRLAPAFDLLISGTAEFSDHVDPAQRTTGNYVATGPGAVITVFDIRTDLLAGKSVRISTGTGGNEPGNITWQALQNRGDLDIDGIGFGRLTLEAAGSV